MVPEPKHRASRLAPITLALLPLLLLQHGPNMCLGAIYDDYAPDASTPRAGIVGSIPEPSRNVQTPNFEVGSTPCFATEGYTPRSTQEVANIITQLYNDASGGQQITVRTSRPGHHSFNRMACPDSPSGRNSRTVQMNLANNLNKVTQIDRTRYQVRAGAGMLIRDFLSVLDSFGMSLPPMSTPIIDNVVLGGIVATEAHGTSFRGPAAFADNVINATWVDGTGRVLESADITTVAGATGHTGIITELWIQVQPSTNTKVRVVQGKGTAQFIQEVQRIIASKTQVQIIWRPDWNRYQIAYVEELAANSATNGGRFSFYEFPKWQLDALALLTKKDQLDEINVLKDTGAKLQLALEPQYWNRPRFLSIIPRPSGIYVGPTNRMMTGGCPFGLCPWDFAKCQLREFTVTTSQLPSFLQDYAQIIGAGLKLGKRPAGLGFYLRFSKPTKNWLGPTYGQESAYFDLATFASPDITDIPFKHQDIDEEVEQVALCQYKGRPHWGKSTQRMLTSECYVRDMYPMFEQFVAAREEADPQNLFLDSTFKKLINRSGNDYYPGCAIDQVCYCKEDSHCNRANTGSRYICAPGRVYPQYKVCRLGSFLG